MLLGGFVHGAKPVDQPFHGPYDGMYPGAFAFEQAGHECAHRLGQGQQNQKKE
jgi:hypothetical protein